MPDYSFLHDRFDFDEGGRLHAFARKTAAIDAPVLIVGLGGTGVETLLRIKKLISETMVCDPEDGKTGDRPKNIAYLGIDTDAYSKKLSMGGVKLSEEESEIRIYEAVDAKHALLHPEFLPPYIRSWFDIDIGDKAVVYPDIDMRDIFFNTGPFRQIGRTLLMMNIGDFKATVEDKICGVVNSRGYSNKTPLYVFVIAGIGGGTGSGMFIDVPYIIRCIADNIDRARPISVIGLLFMPDVNALKVMGDSTAVASLYTNGFAALKELEYLTNIKERHDIFDQVYGDLDTKVLADGGEGIAPYNICMLMSSKDKDGALPEGLSPWETYRQTLQNAAERIFNFVLGNADEMGMDDYSIWGFLGNEAKNVHYYRTILGDTRHPVNYSFNISGISSAVLPMDDVMSYLTWQAFKTVDTLWDKEPTGEELEEMEAELMLTRMQMEAAAKNECRWISTARVEYRDCAEEPEWVVSLFEFELKQDMQIVKSNISDLLGEIIHRLDDENNVIFRAFKDLEKGPVYAGRCICRLLDKIQCLRNDLLSDGAVSPQRMNALEKNAIDNLAEILRWPHRIFGREDVLQYCLKALKAFYNGKFKREINKMLVSACDTIIKALIHKNETIFEPCSRLMTTLMSIFDKYGQICTEDGEGHHDDMTSFSWQLVDAPTFIRELEKYIRLHPEMSANPERVVSDFYTYLFENADLWSGGRSGDIAGEINDFLYKEFEKSLDLDMDQLLEIAAAARGYDSLQTYCDDILRDLNKRARVHFPLDGMDDMSAVAQPSYSFISLPDNAPTLYKAVQRAMNMADGARIVKKSGIKNRVYMMNFASATPLAAYGDMVNLYKAYKVNRSGYNGAGLHLYMKTRYSDLDWTMLPSPYPETEWVDFDDPKERELNDHYREVLRKAIEYGYVTENQHEHKMTLKWDGEIDLEAFAVERGIELDSNELLSERTGKEGAGALDALIRDVDGRCRKIWDCNDMIMENEHIKKSAQEITFIGLFAIRDEIEKMVKNHEEAEAVREQIKRRTADERDIEDFAACMLYQLVDQDPESVLDYIYYDRDGGYFPLCSLTARQNRYKEHYIMMAFLALPSDVKKVLCDEAEARKRKRPTLEELERLENLRSDILGKLKKMFVDYRTMAEGEVILSSYQLMDESIQNLADLFGV